MTAQPKLKVNAFFDHVNKFSLEPWDPSPFLVLDGHFQRFTSSESGTSRYNFKYEEDGFFIDALCDDGCTITCYPMNHPHPLKHASIQHCPLHARVLFLMYQLVKDSYQKIVMDNLFTVKKIAIGAQM